MRGLSSIGLLDDHVEPRLGGRPEPLERVVGEDVPAGREQPADHHVVLGHELDDGPRRESARTGRASIGSGHVPRDRQVVDERQGEDARPGRPARAASGAPCPAQPMPGARVGDVEDERQDVVRALGRGSAVVPLRGRRVDVEGEHALAGIGRDAAVAARCSRRGPRPVLRAPAARTRRRAAPWPPSRASL